MESNFSFLKNVDNELYEIIEDAQKLFCDEYFSQCVIQTRIFAEKMARKIVTLEPHSTFDDALQCLKDKIKTEREREFVDDLFFIKKEGNACAHGEDTEVNTALEVIQRAFEASINYVYAKTKDKSVDELLFDTTLLITQKKSSKTPLVEKYLEAATKELDKEELLNNKQAEFKTAPKAKKLLTPTQQKIKEKVKKAKKNLRQNINKIPKKQTKKQIKKKKTNLKAILFFIFVIISILFLLKMFCVF